MEAVLTDRAPHAGNPEPRKTIYVARTVANGVEPKRLMPLLIFFVVPIMVGQPVILGLLALLAVVFIGGMRVRRASRLEWDGEELYWCEWPKRRLVAVRGDGWVVRVAMSPPSLGRANTPMNFLVWCDHTGRARSPFMPERLWDPVQLERLRNAAWMPIADDASRSLKDIGTRYPGSVPWYIMKPQYLFLAALPLAILLIVLVPPR